jgi:hypothetical protein
MSDDTRLFIRWVILITFIAAVVGLSMRGILSHIDKSEARIIQACTEGK